jgi:hypothetical protein
MWYGGSEALVVELGEIGSGHDTGDLDPDLPAYLGRDDAVVPGDDLHVHTQLGQLGDRRARVRLGRVGEGEEAGQGELALVLGGDGRGSRREVTGCHRDDAVPVGEEPVQCGLSTLRKILASGEHGLGRTLADEHRRAILPGHEHGGHLPLVVERQDPQAAVSGRPIFPRS